MNEKSTRFNREFWFGICSSSFVAAAWWRILFYPKTTPVSVIITFVLIALSIQAIKQFVDYVLES